MLRLGLTQRVAIVETTRERRDCLDQAWTHRLSAHDYLPVPLPNRIADVPGMLKALELDGLILTGGNDLNLLPEASNPAPERDRLEHRLITIAAEMHLPILGVCRGLQVLVTHYGGRVTPVSAHVGDPHGIDVRPVGRALLGERKRVNSFHAYGIHLHDVGSDLEILATASDGSVEAVAHKRVPQWGIMWHPERAPHDPRDMQLLNAIFTRSSG